MLKNFDVTIESKLCQVSLSEKGIWICPVYGSVDDEITLEWDSLYLILKKVRFKKLGE